MKTTNVSRKICAALIGAGILGSAPLFGANFDKTVNEGESFSKQQNDVTGGTVVINGTWDTPDKRVIANTKDESTPYGFISVSVGESGIIRSGGDTLILQKGAQVDGDIAGGKGSDTIEIDVGDGNAFEYSGKIYGVELISVKSGELLMKDGSQLVIRLFADGSCGTVEGSAKFEDGAVVVFEMADSSLASEYRIFTDADFGDNVLFEGPDGYELGLEGLANGTIGFVQVPEPAVMAAMAGLISLPWPCAAEKSIWVKGYRINTH